MYTHTDGRGRTITYRYDTDDRPTGSGNYVAINYPNDTDVQITRDADGLITSTVDASGTTTNVYYPSTWLKTKTVSAGTSKTLTYEYNGVGLVSRLTTPESTTFDYTYNGRNQLATVTDPSDVEVSFSYDNGGRRTRITRPGSYIDYSYNARDWVTWVHNRLTNGDLPPLALPPTVSYSGRSRALVQRASAGVGSPPARAVDSPTHCAA